MPNRPKQTTQRRAGTAPPSTAAVPTDSSSTAAFRHRGAPKPARLVGNGVGGVSHQAMLAAGCLSSCC
jgi:hypothetical protein